MRAKRGKRINEAKYNELAAKIAVHGVKDVAEATGYAPRTLSSIKNTADFKEWEGKFRAPRRTKLEAPTAKATPAAPTATPLKKPGHAYTSTWRPAPQFRPQVQKTVDDGAAPTTASEYQYVTKEALDEIELELHSKVVGLRSQIVSLSKRVNTLESDNRAFDITDAAAWRDPRPWWRKLIDRIGGR